MRLDLSSFDFRATATEIAIKAAGDNRPSYYAEPFVPARSTGDGRARGAS